ncbi:MAG: hypothetical protein IT221_04510 [Fluviicola sp.]|nr:hypothetical protein [Fluviicola sp.]
MKPIIKPILIVGVLIFGIFGIAYFAFLQIDFIGQKDPKIVKENLKRWNNTLLSAEYRNGSDFCKVDLLDSVTIEINVGDKTGSTILTEKYKLNHDTIIVIGGVKHASKYLNSNKFLIQENKLLFKLAPNGLFDTKTTMAIKFNEIKRYAK